MMNEKKDYKIKKILLAAGESKRFGNKNKLTEVINGKPIISHILDTLFEIFDPSEIIVMLIKCSRNVLREYRLRKLEWHLHGSTS